MRINVHAGHNPAGKVACGAVGLMNESTENRRVKDEVISQLREMGHTVYDCTVNNGTGQKDVLKKIVAKCNEHDVDLDVSIHFNAGASDNGGNDKTTGVEVLVYSASNKSVPYAERTAQAIADLGYRQRSDATSPAAGIKVNSSLYVLKNTKAPAMLVECCFVDDKDDMELYDYRSMAAAIVKGITGEKVQESEETDKAEPGEETPTVGRDPLYRVQTGAFKNKANAEALRDKLRADGYDTIITMA